MQGKINKFKEYNLSLPKEYLKIIDSLRDILYAQDQDINLFLGHS